LREEAKKQKQLDINELSPS